MRQRDQAPAHAPPHPMQPVVRMDDGVHRFKPNAIVQHLLDKGTVDLNAIARLPFSREDRTQFAQLIGYSVSGAGDLSYFDDAVRDRALDDSERIWAAETGARVRYDVRLRGPRCDRCEVTPDELHLEPTLHLEDVFDLALDGDGEPSTDAERAQESAHILGVRGLLRLDGLGARASVHVLKRALERMDDPGQLGALFHEMEPEEEPGRLDGAAEVLRGMLAAAEGAPNSTWSVT